MYVPLRVAVVGFGFMGRTHAACFQSNSDAKLVAVCSPSIHSSATQKVQGNLDTSTELNLAGVELVADWRELLERDDIDALDLCLPTPQHAEVAIAFLNAGKHVLCEKPMARSLAECDAMIEAQTASGKTLMLGHVLRFWPHYVRAHELISEGEVGEVVSARFERQSPWPRWSAWLGDFEQSGGAPLDLGLHDADVALWWFGQPTRVQAAGANRGEMPVVLDASWIYPGGPHVHHLCSWDESDAPYRMAFEVVGTRATLRFDSGRDGKLHLFRQGEAREIEVSGEDAYQAQLRYFGNCVSSGTQPDKGTPEQARMAVKWVLEEMKHIASC